MGVKRYTFEVRTFGEKFKELREMTGLKQLHFEEKGFTKNCLSNYENGRRRVNKRDRKKLISIAQRSTDLLFDVDYYYSSAEEELELKISHYKETLYDDSDAFVLAVNKALSLKMDELVVSLYYEKGKHLFSRYKFRDSIREYMNALNYVKKPKNSHPEIYKSIADSFEKLHEMGDAKVI